MKELTPIHYNSAAISVQRYRVPPHKSCFRTHWHDRMEVLRIRQGTLFVGHGENTTPADQNTMVIWPPQAPHSGYTGDEAVEYDVLMFDVRAFYNDTQICQHNLTALFDGGQPTQYIADNTPLRDCVDRLCAGALSPMEEVAEVYRLFALLFDGYLAHLPQNEGQHLREKQFIRYLEEHCARDLSLEEISQHFGYTKAHFCRKFRDFTGLSPMRYLQIVRVEKGFALLRSGKQNVGEVALLCGFSDPNYFTRCFRAHFGFPPSAVHEQT